MVEISTNFPTKYTSNKCECGEIEEMEHIYNCEMFGKQPKISYKKLYTGNIQEQIGVFKQFEEKMNERENLKNDVVSPRDPSGIHCSLNSNG